MVKPPGLLIPGTKTSSHWPGRNWASRVCVLAVALLACRDPCRVCSEELNEVRIRQLDRQLSYPQGNLIRDDAGALTLMLPTEGGMARTKVRMEGLTSSICLRMTVWSDC